MPSNGSSQLTFPVSPSFKKQHFARSTLAHSRATVALSSAWLSGSLENFGDGEKMLPLFFVSTNRGYTFINLTRITPLPPQQVEPSQSRHVLRRLWHGRCCVLVLRSWIFVGNHGTGGRISLLSQPDKIWDCGSVNKGSSCFCKKKPQYTSGRGWGVSVFWSWGIISKDKPMMSNTFGNGVVVLLDRPLPFREVFLLEIKSCVLMEKCYHDHI